MKRSKRSAIITKVKPSFLAQNVQREMGRSSMRAHIGLELWFSTQRQRIQIADVEL